MKKPNGGTAFPMQDPQAIHAYAVAAIDGITDPDDRDRVYTKARAEAVGGMSLRDYFAGQVLVGLSIRREGKCDKDDANMAYSLADAMLAAREDGE